jgi:predicted pyridoxine 5'-phosphate oxidase superfamily flavin-nucleotide-binding protein
MNATPREAFHAGERALQQREGMREAMERVGRIAVRDYMPDQHREFYAELPFFLLGARDREAQPWATVLVGEPGFVSSPDQRSLATAGGWLAGDPLASQLRVGDQVGGLGLAPMTRRRNRVNGVIEDMVGGAMRIAVRQSFGNCPKYIQNRQQSPRGADAEVKVARSAALTAQDRELIARADTYFIASAHAESGADVSHRGGRPGFVRVTGDGALMAPEFAGNHFFNTLGNLLEDGRAGLLFIDFERGDLLHLAVDAEIIWDGPEVGQFAGAEHLLRYHVRAAVRRSGALPWRWSAPVASPHLERTGAWPG